jgi:hypothetical protein
MKIKSDFITNSSSTSFILITKENFNEESFYRHIGLEKEFPLDYLFHELFESIDYNKEEINDYIKNNYPEYTVSEFLKNGHYFDFDDNTIQEVIQRYDLGDTVFVGTLSTESNRNDSETFFCMESFIIIDEDFYLNSEMSIW